MNHSGRPNGWAWFASSIRPRGCWRESDLLSYAPPQPRRRIKHRRQGCGEMYLHTKTVKKRVHWMLTWKTQIWEKTTAALRLQNITISGLQQWGTEATTSCSLASPPGGYNRGNNLFLSLSLSLFYVHNYALNYRNNDNDTTNSTS